MPQDTIKKFRQTVDIVEDIVGGDVPRDLIKVAVAAQDVNNSDFNLEEVSGQAQSAVDIAQQLDELADALQAFGGGDQLRVDLENDNLGTNLDADIAEQSLAQLTTVIEADDDAGNTAEIQGEELGTALGGTETAVITYLCQALAAIGNDQLRVDLQNNNVGTLPTEQQTPVGIENEAGQQVDPKSADAAYENSTTVSANGEIANLLVARGGEKIEGRVVSSGSYDVVARFKDDAGNTIFTDTIASAVAGGTQTQLGPNDNEVEVDSDRVEIAVLEQSGNQQSVDAVLHYV